MIDLNQSGSGIFYPHELASMARELREGDKPGEQPSEREERARCIVNSRDLVREKSSEA